MFKCGWLAGGINISENPEKQIMPCCHVDKRDPVLLKNIYNGKDIVNGHTLSKMRKEAINGKVPELCRVCVDQENLGIESPRMRSIKNFNNKGIIKEHIDASDVEELYLKFSNLCNFKCVMCSGGSSHLIAKEKWNGKSLIEINEFYEEQLLELLPNMKNLRSIQITGGEPLLHKSKNINILNKLPKTVKIQYRSNGSVYDKDIVKLLKKFNNPELLLSIDGYKDILHYQRPNSNWTQIEENLKKYKNEDVRLINTLTSTCFNFCHLPNFIEDTKKYFDYTVFTPVRFPKEMRINLIKKEKLYQVIKQLKNISIAGDLGDFIIDIENNYLEIPSLELVLKFWKTVEYMEKHRSVNLAMVTSNIDETFYRMDNT
jgi:organic radical activating enzyme